MKVIKPPEVSADGMYWVYISGVTLEDIGNQLTFANASIQKSIQTLSIDISLNDSTIKNLTLAINANLTLTNSTVHNELTRVLVNESTIHSEVQNYSTNIQLTDNLINTTVHLVSTNVTLFQNYVKTYLNTTENNIKLQENFLNTTLNTVYNNLTLFQTYVHDTINATLTDVNLRDQYMNDTVGVISNNVSLLQTYTKDVIHSEMNNLSVVSTYINDTMGNMNISFNSKVSILNTTMNNVNLNATTYFQIEHDIMNSIKANQTDIYKATELSGAYSYKLVPENVVAVSGGIEMQLWVENHDGTVVNSSQLVHYLFENMSAEIMSLNGQGGVPPKLISYTAHYMTVEFPLTSQEISSLESGANDTMIQVFSPFYTGGVADIATGSILPSSFPAQQLTWYEQYLGFKSPPPGGFMPDVWWIILSIPGFLSVGILGALVSIYYLLKIRSDLRDGQKKKEEEAKKEEDRRMLKEIHKKVTEND